MGAARMIGVVVRWAVRDSRRRQRLLPSEEDPILLAHPRRRARAPTRGQEAREVGASAHTWTAAQGVEADVGADRE